MNLIGSITKPGVQYRALMLSCKHCVLNTKSRNPAQGLQAFCTHQITGRAPASVLPLVTLQQQIESIFLTGLKTGKYFARD